MDTIYNEASISQRKIDNMRAYDHRATNKKVTALTHNFQSINFTDINARSILNQQYVVLNPMNLINWRRDRDQPCELSQRQQECPR
jgi:hypothetical protein